MAENLFLEFCKMFYEGTFIPFHVFNGEKIILQRPKQEHFFILVSKYIQPLLASAENPAYLTTGSFDYYGIVKSKSDNRYIIVGPIISTTCSKDTVRDIMAAAHMPHEYWEEIYGLFQLFPIISFTQFLHVLALFYFELNHENVRIEKILDIENAAISKPICSLHALGVYQTKEEQSFHSTYKYECRLMKYVEDGDVEGLKQFLEGPVSIREGVIADNTLRQVKNVFVVVTTIATRMAICGGLDEEIAYMLSDTYIMQMEKSQSMDAIYQLQYAMMMDFTKRVADAKIPEGISSDIYKCIQFISSNTNRMISVSDVADSIGKSRSYTSRKFKAEMGIDLNAFMMQKRMAEAKNLLAFTDKTISEISYYLCFSSQSYFQNVFKKSNGITPNEYRNRSNHIRLY